MKPEKNAGWTVYYNYATRTTEEIQPGESREYEVWMRYDNYLTNLGTKENKVRIIGNENVAGFKDVGAGNDEARAGIVIAISTGLGRTGDTIMIILLSIAIAGVISAIVVEAVKKRKLNK